MYQAIYQCAIQKQIKSNQEIPLSTWIDRFSGPFLLTSFHLSPFRSLLFVSLFLLSMMPEAGVAIVKMLSLPQSMPPSLLEELLSPGDCSLPLGPNTRSIPIIGFYLIRPGVSAYKAKSESYSINSISGSPGYKLPPWSSAP